MQIQWTGARPGNVIGYRRNGAPIRLIGGGAEDEPGVDTTAGAGQSGDGKPDAQPDQKPEPDWKARARDWENRAKANKAAAEANADKARRLDEMEAASASELEKAVKAAVADKDAAVKAARDEATKETATAYQRRLASAEVRAAAGGKLVDPDIAPRLLDLDALIGEDGEPDDAAIRKAVDELVKDKPFLAAVTKPADFDGGARSGAGVPEATSPGMGTLRAAYAKSSTAPK